MQCTRFRFLTSVSITILAVVLGGCHGSGNDEPAEGIENAAEALERALAPREVSLVQPDVRTENPSIELVGEIRAFDTVVISSEVGGRVDRVLVEVGDTVAKGTPLVEVDRETFAIYLAQAEANVKAARANLSLTEKDLERKRDLRSDETIPQAALDQAQSSHDLATAEVAGAEAALNLAKRNHDRSVIRAPAAGAITERSVVAGQWADVGAPLLELAIGSKVKVAAPVPQAWVGQFADLESFTFTVGIDSTHHTAEIYSLQPVVREASRSYEIVGAADNDGSLRPGMFATVTLTSPESRRTLWLPASAVSTSDLPQVLMVDNGEVAYRKVQIGRRDGTEIEVVSGLQEGEQVILDVSGLTRGLPVAIID
ncbi:MAG: efflux RND transporter periplasmic adaptor subunit [Thermoanaerobaculales bacterium]|jgi:membrane fusion protein (multidrug efflux system)|nr:efflux RND transporter periplasmic adaptor subunit [Thermoanaerobaculales bacterium]